MDNLTTDYLSTLPVDLIFQLLTYLSFQDVVNVSKVNSKLHSYCINPQYNNKWKRIIDNTYCSIAYDYENKLKKVWSKLHLVDGTYNYLVYTKLIKLLDSITRFMIYYRQGDTTSFNTPFLFEDQKFLSLFLLNKPTEMEIYRSDFYTKSYYLLLQGKMPTINDLNSILIRMATYGNMRGVKYLLDKGADIHSQGDITLGFASKRGHLDVVKYLVKKGADIHGDNDKALRWASRNGHLDVVKYLVEQGADVHAHNDAALKWATDNGYHDVVKYLQEHI